MSILSANRSRVGAAVNRLEHVHANLLNGVESQKRAWSLIRDADMASVATEAAKRDVLFNAGAGIFRQANYSAPYLLNLFGA